MTAAARPFPLVPALRSVVLVWAFELALARLSSDPQDPLDLVKSLAGLLALGVAPLPLVWLISRRRWRDGLTGLVAALPLALVWAGILLAPAMTVRPILGPILAAATFIAVGAWRFIRGFRSAEPFAASYSIAVGTLAAAVLAWWMMNGSLPGLALWLPLLGAFAVLAVLGLRSVGTLAAAALAVVLALWPAGGATPAWSGTGPGADGPDIVLLCVDTLRADAGREMAAYARLAEDGVRFPNTLAASPWTLPSMATALTGLRPWEHGAGKWKDHRTVGLAEETPTLAERLRDAGYDTAAVVHNPVLGGYSGFSRGFDMFESASRSTRWALPRTRNTMEGRPFVAHLLSLVKVGGRRLFFDSEAIADRAAEILDQRRDRPLFLWLHFLDCHFPYRRADGAALPWARRMELERGDADAYRADPYWATLEGQHALHVAYRREIEAVDRALLRILDALGPPPERGRIVVLFSDHGEEFFEHGGVEHGHAFWEEVVAVPLVIQGLAGRETGSEETELVGHADLARTLLAAAGLEGPPEAGRDLAGDLDPTALWCLNLLHYDESFDEGHAARDGFLKVIYGPEGAAVFDLRSDPTEQTDLSASRAELVERYREPPETNELSTHGSSERNEDLERSMSEIGYTEG